MQVSQVDKANLDISALEDHGHRARLADGLIEAVNLPLHQIHEGRALAADTAAAGQNGQSTACKQLLSLSQTYDIETQVVSRKGPADSLLKRRSDFGSSSIGPWGSLMTPLMSTSPSAALGTQSFTSN